jgi:hypothetical protein
MDNKQNQMRSCIIIGGGRSVRAERDDLWYNIHKHENVWTLNFVFKFMPYLPKAIVWYDYLFAKRVYYDLMNAHQCVNAIRRICALTPQYTDEFFYSSGWRAFEAYTATHKAENFKGLDSKSLNMVYSGKHRLSGTFALSLAVCEVDTVYLLGYDFGVFGDKTHWYQEEAKLLNIESSGFNNHAVYLKPKTDVKLNQPNDFIKDFDVFTTIPKKIVVVGQSNLYQFEKIDYKEFYERIANEEITNKTIN